MSELTALKFGLPEDLDVSLCNKYGTVSVQQIHMLQQKVGAYTRVVPVNRGLLL